MPVTRASVLTPKVWWTPEASASKAVEDRAVERAEDSRISASPRIALAERKSSANAAPGCHQPAFAAAPPRQTGLSPDGQLGGPAGGKLENLQSPLIALSCLHRISAGNGARFDF